MLSDYSRRDKNALVVASQVRLMKKIFHEYIYYSRLEYKA